MSARTEITFNSAGTSCAAWLYRATRPSGAVPIVVMAHGLGAVREMRLDAYAERIAAAGMAALVFDYRHLGESGGEPRQLIDIDKQLDDWRAAIAHARRLDGVDAGRIALWGTSFSGGHVVKLAAEDPALAAVVSQVPFADGLSAMRTAPFGQLLGLTWAGIRDEWRARTGRPPRYIPLIGEPGSLAIFTEAHAEERLEATLPEGFELDNRYAPRLNLRIGSYRPYRSLKNVNCPVLVCIAEQDVITPPAPVIAAVNRVPHAELRRYPLEHFDIYIGEGFERAVGDQVEFLTEHLLRDARPSEAAAEESAPARFRANVRGLTTARSSASSAGLGATARRPTRATGADVSAPPKLALPRLVQGVWYWRDPVGLFRFAQARLGPIFRLKFPGYPDYVVVADPALAREVYAADGSVGLVGPIRRDVLGPIVGDRSLLCVEGDEWLRQRKLVGPAFHRKRIDRRAEEIAAIARDQVESWPLTEEFTALPLRPCTQAITLEVILRLVIGGADPARLDELRQLVPELIEAGGSPPLSLVSDETWSRIDRSRLARQVPWPLRRFLRLRDAVDRLLFAEIADRRRQPADRGDVLSLLLAGDDGGGPVMGDRELRDQVVTLLEAGHETTATALAWTFERLVRHPAVLQRLERELVDGQTSYLEAVIREALRTRPVVLDTPRQLVGPLDVGDYVLEKGWCVAPAMPLVHESGAFTEPNEFRPERWLDAHAPQQGWIPFGGGKRHCVGSHLALLELRVISKEILGRVEFEGTDAPPETGRLRHVTLVPSQGGLVRARRRPASAGWGAPSEHRTGASACPIDCAEDPPPVPGRARL